MAEQFGIDELGGDGAAIDAEEWPTIAARLLVNCAGDNFLARAGFAQDQYRNVGSGDQIDPIHHRLEARFDADDGVGHFVAAELGEQRAIFGFDFFAQRDKLAEAAIVFQRDREGFEQHLEEFFVFVCEDVLRMRQEQKGAGRTIGGGKRAGEDVAVGVLGKEAG